MLGGEVGYVVDDVEIGARLMSLGLRQTPGDSVVIASSLR